MFSDRHRSYNEQTQNIGKILQDKQPNFFKLQGKKDGESVTKIKAMYMGLI